MNPLNNSFETWSSPGTEGVSDGVCTNWTTCSENGGTATRYADAAPPNGTYVLKLRPSAAAPVTSVGGIYSDAWNLVNNYITFYTKSDNASMYSSVVILDSSDRVLATATIPYYATWTQVYLDVTAFNGQSIKIKFRVRTDSGAYGYARFIDYIQCSDSSSGTQLTLIASHIEDPSIEDWFSTGTGGSSSGSLHFWTPYSVNGGTCSRKTDAPTGGETYSADIRSSAAAPVNSIGGIVSTLFYLNQNTISWYQKSSNANVAVTVELLDSGDSVIASTTPAIVTSWTQQTWDVSAYTGQNVKIRFSQHTTQAGSGHSTYIDLVTTSQIATHETILSDAKIKATDISNTILSDAKIIIYETITSDAKIVIEVLSNINNYVNTVKQVLSDINNKFNTVKRVLSDINCFINTCKSVISDFNNDFRTKKLTLNNVNNDIRFIYSWQRAADNSFQSLGKSYIRVYIATVEQTDVDIDSINISKDLNNSHTASFDLGRAYDATKPTIESVVEIKYNDWVLFKGYITEISPAEDPEKMRINCQDEYWKQNKSNVYYHVGHAPADNKELYYSTIKTALSTQHGWNLSIGDFIPQEINNFGVGKSDGISNLIQEIGNYGWFYEIDGTKKLWIAGEGNIIDLERQTLGTNINLYQVLNHSFTDSVDDLVNKYRVQMGDKVIRALNETGNSRTYAGYNYSSYNAFVSPAWNSQYEGIVTPENPGTGEGWNYHKPANAYLYKDVFKKYYMPYLDTKLSSWSDRYPAYVEIYSDWGTYGASSGRLYEGFSIDYENKTITFNNPIYQYLTNDKGEITAVRAPSIKVFLWKKNYYTYTVDPTDDPETDISNPLMFFTAKMGSYADTVIKDLNLSNLSIQEGGSYTKESQSTSEVQIYDGVNKTFTLEHTGQTSMFITVNCVELNSSNYSYNPTAGTVTITSSLTTDDYLTFVYDYTETIIIPSWDDTDFAEDLANWQLSKLCDKRIKGTIEITLDALCYYNIDLTNRIYIDGITESAMNITNIDYDISNFTVRLTLENSRYYNRTISYPSHGE